MDNKDTKQLTIRLDPNVIEDLDALVEKMQKSSAPGVLFTRTDALRSAIIRGIESLSGGKKR